jgi:hypothetical protein
MKAIAIVFVAGLIVGIVGGVVTGDGWFHGGEAVVVGGLACLYAYAAWKRPDVLMVETIDSIDDEPQPPPADALTMEHELRRKDRGEERRGP